MAACHRISELEPLGDVRIWNGQSSGDIHMYKREWSVSELFPSLKDINVIIAYNFIIFVLFCFRNRLNFDKQQRI